MKIWVYSWVCITDINKGHRELAHGGENIEKIFAPKMLLWCVELGELNSSCFFAPANRLSYIQIMTTGP